MVDGLRTSPANPLARPQDRYAVESVLPWTSWTGDEGTRHDLVDDALCRRTRHVAILG